MWTEEQKEEYQKEWRKNHPGYHAKKMKYYRSLKEKPKRKKREKKIYSGNEILITNIKKKIYNKWYCIANKGKFVDYQKTYKEKSTDTFLKIRLKRIELGHPIN